jgi:hypothetical protein
MEIFVGVKISNFWGLLLLSKLKDTIITKLSNNNSHYKAKKILLLLINTKTMFLDMLHATKYDHYKRWTIWTK